MTVATHTCEMCGSPLVTPDAKRFCSRTCANRRQKPAVTRSCETCSQEFNALLRKDHATGRERFCSRPCYLASVQPEPRPCARCGEPIPQTSWSHEAKFCSQACYHAVPNRLRKGEYGGGRIYNTFFQRQRALALERDEFACGDCGATQWLVAHHVVPYRISESHALNNLRTLCRSCHRRADHAYQVAERGGAPNPNLTPKAGG